jgi:hypothetical protein
MCLGGIAPPDDASNFVSNTGLPPLMISSFVLADYVIGWIFFRSRIYSLRSELAFFQMPDQEIVTRADW